MALARIYPCSPVPGAQVHGSAGGVVRRRWNWGGGFLCSLFRRFNESSITEYFRTYVRSTEASHYYRQTSLRFDFFFSHSFGVIHAALMPLPVVLAPFASPFLSVHHRVALFAAFSWLRTTSAALFLLPTSL